MGCVPSKEPVPGPFFTEPSDPMLMAKLNPNLKPYFKAGKFKDMQNTVNFEGDIINISTNPGIPIPQPQNFCDAKAVYNRMKLEKMGMQNFEEKELKDQEIVEGKTYFVAVFDFVGRTSEDLSFLKNDILLLIDDSNEHWFLCINIATAKKGYVPSNHLAQEKSLELEDWYFGEIRRLEAEFLIKNDGRCGSFLISKSSLVENKFALSVLDGNKKINHYIIKNTDDGLFYITARAIFKNLFSLVGFYSNKESGLSTILKQSPSKIAPATVRLSKDIWEQPHENFHLLDELGRGHFGCVYKALHMGKTPVAVKLLKTGTISKEEFLREANIMKKIRHPNLIQLFAVCTGDDLLYIVTEYMHNGSLLGYLHKMKDDFDTDMQIDACKQVAYGMSYLCGAGFIHRDLAARNVLVSNNLCYKVADFGLTRCQEDDIYQGSTNCIFPIKWTAPEACDEKIFSEKSDVWSYGILMYEVVTKGKTPYEDLNNNQTRDFLSQGFRLAQPNNCDDNLYDIMTMCWESSPEKRPSFKDIIFHFEDLFIEEFIDESI